MSILFSLQGYATTPHEDSKESSFVQVDCSPLEQNEHSTEALAAGIIESTVVKEEAQDEDYIESLHSATEDAKAFAPSQEEQILTVDPEDISRDKKIENITDASDKEKILNVQVKSYNQLSSTTPTLLSTYLNNKLASL